MNSARPLHRLLPRHRHHRTAWHGSVLQRRRLLVTLAIETSCDDTGVAVLERSPAAPGAGPSTSTTALLFNERVSSDNRAFGGVHPLVAVNGHSEALAPLVRRALAALPEAARGREGPVLSVDGRPRRVPDFVSVTRGPGMRAGLGVGLDTAKGLALAWGVPLVGVHHMQAHALTPRLARALGLRMGSAEGAPTDGTPADGTPAAGPDFPFLSLLVSGGHTQLVHSAGLTAHRVVAATGDVALGNLLDQLARDILPPDVLAASDHVMYGRLLEAFAFAEPGPAAYDAVFAPAATRAAEMADVPSGYAWTVPLPFRQSRRLAFSFSGIYTHVRELAAAAGDRRWSVAERRALARHTMMAAFKHVAGRLCLALEDRPDLRGARTLVVAGGVACNRFLMHVLRRTLQARGFALDIVAPPVELCTDNAAMIAWAGMEMYEAGHCSDLSILSIGKWPMDPDQGGGIMGVDGWLRRES